MTYRRLTTMTVTRALLCLCGFTIPAVSAAEPPRLADSELKDLQDRWVGFMKTAQIPGFAIVVVRGDQVIALDGFGLANVESQKPVNPDTIFYIASCTKPFNALLAVALSEDKKLDLDAPVQKYLPRFRLSDSTLTGAISCRDLMCHRYGINSGDIVFNDAYSGNITDDLYFRLLPDAEIKKEVNYSNVHYTILGRVIQAVGGKDWRDVLAERILKPAGMVRTTGYADRMYADANVAMPHVYDGGKWTISPVRKTDRTMHAAGGLGSSARDLGIWLRLHLNRGQIDGRRVVTEEGMKQMITEQSKMPSPRGQIRREDSFGLGWNKGTFRGKGPYYSHGGGYIGSAAYVAFMPEEKIGMAVVVNCGDVGGALVNLIGVDVFDRLLGTKPQEDLLKDYTPQAKAFLARPSSKPAEPNPAADGARSQPAKDYVGSYVSEIDGELRIGLNGQSFTAVLGDLNFELISKSVDSFTAWAVRGVVQGGEFEVSQGKVVAVVLTDTESGKVRRFVKKS